MTLRNRRSWWAAGGACTVVAVASYAVEIQGFNLLDDGIWALGTQTLASGGVLYRDFFTIYGPAKFYLLLPFFQILGSSVHTLAVVKSLVAGAAAALGFCVRGPRRRMLPAWFVFGLVLAIGPVPPRYVAAAAFALLYAAVRRTVPAGGGPLRAAGAAWGVLSLFGLDMFVYGLVIVAVTAALDRHAGRPEVSAAVRRVAFGFGVTALAACGAMLLAGSLSPFAWDTIVCPLTAAPAQLTAARGGVSLFPVGADQDFSQVFTGEVLPPPWPGLPPLRPAAMLLLALLVFIVPTVFVVEALRKRETGTGPLLGLALAGWVTVVWRYDVAHLLAAGYGVVLLVAHGMHRFRSGRAGAATAALGAACLLAVAVLPLAGERLWLAAHLERPTMARWNSPRGEVRLARERIATIDRTLARVDRSGSAALLAWPAQPGLVFLSGLPPAMSQVTLLPGSVRDPDALVARMAADPPRQIVLGGTAGLTGPGRSLQESFPAVWAFLRKRYGIAYETEERAEGLRLIRPLGPGHASSLGLPLASRLPGTAQLVKNSMSPRFPRVRSVGQTFRVGALDLSGLTVDMAVSGTLPTTTDVTLTITRAAADAAPGPVGTFRTTVAVHEPIQRCSFAFGSLPGTANAIVTATFRLEVPPGYEASLLWHDERAAEGRGRDYYTGGTAAVDGVPVPADLFFVSY